MDRYEEVKIVITNYTNGTMYRTWAFDPTSCKFTHASNYVTNIGEVGFHENHPTNEDVRKYTLEYNGKCGRCANDLENNRCLRGPCYWYGMKYVPEHGYCKKTSVKWDVEKICYSLKKIQHS